MSDKAVAIAKGILAGLQAASGIDPRVAVILRAAELGIDVVIDTIEEDAGAEVAGMTNEEMAQAIESHRQKRKAAKDLIQEGIDRAKTE